MYHGTVPQKWSAPSQVCYSLVSRPGLHAGLAGMHSCRAGGNMWSSCCWNFGRWAGKDYLVDQEGFLEAVEWRLPCHSARGLLLLWWAWVSPPGEAAAQVIAALLPKWWSCNYSLQTCTSERVCICSSEELSVCQQKPFLLWYIASVRAAASCDCCVTVISAHCKHDLSCQQILKSICKLMWSSPYVLQLMGIHCTFTASLQCQCSSVSMLQV